MEVKRNIDKLVTDAPRIREESRAAATSKMECFVVIVNGFQPLTIITKRSILDVAAALDQPLQIISHVRYIRFKCFLLLLLQLAKLFNDHILFQEYTPFKFVCLLYIGQASFTSLAHVSSKFAWSLEKARTN